jgi:two-component system phosphate regulon sensor histidine kinase PhoR
MFWKLASISVASILAATLVVALLAEHYARADMARDIEGSLRAEAALLAEMAQPALHGDVPADLEARVRAVGTATGVRLTIVRADGKVVAESERDPADMDNHLRRPEIADALVHGTGHTERDSSSTGARYAYFAQRVPVSGEPLAGFVRAAAPLAQIDARAARLRTLILSGGGVTALVAVLLSLYFTRRFTAPLTAMTEMAEGIARGEYERNTRWPGHDEIARLGQAFDTMTTQLEERLSTITSDRNRVLAILASMVEGVIAIDRDERVVHMNAVAGSVLGVVPNLCVGRRIWEVTRVMPVCEILDRVRRTSEEESAECQIVGELGAKVEPRTLELRASPLRDAEGAQSGAVVVLHDVTALRKLESVRRDFVANVSHELKTPLTAIRALVETLLDDREMAGATRTRFLEKIRDQSARLSALVGDLLTLARIESNEEALERRVLDVRGPARESLARFAAAAGAKELALEGALPDDAVPVKADDESLRQIFDNLLDNACKYTPSGGRIEVRVARDGGEVEIAVQDTGIGIEPRDQARVFERFYRVDKARSRELGGTGLGLSIVKHYALALDGRVALDSTPGKGSTFRVYLPAA